MDHFVQHRAGSKYAFRIERYEWGWYELIGMRLLRRSAVVLVRRCLRVT